MNINHLRHNKSKLYVPLFYDKFNNFTNNCGLVKSTKSEGIKS